MASFFKQITDAQKYIKIPGGFDLNIAEPFFKQVENKEIKSILGESTYDAALADYTANDLNGTHAELIIEIQGAVMAYGMYLAIPHLNVQLNNGSLQRASNENYVPATRWSVRDLQISMLHQSSRYFDSLLQWLDSNETAAFMAAYLGSAERKAWKNTFIYSPKVANAHLGNPIDYYLLLKMQPIIKRSARDCVKPLVCDALYTELLRLNSENLPWGVYEPLREYIEEAVINHAMAAAVPEIRLSYDDQGVGIIYGRVQKEGEAQDSNEAALYQARNQWQNVSNNALALLKAELDTNTANYPLYASSPCAVNVDFVPLANNTRLYNGFMTT